MSMKSWKNLASAAAVALTASFGAAQAAEPIKIGAFLSATGPASFLGDPEKKVLEKYVAEYNKAGGLMGRKIDLVLYDDAGAADKASSFVKRLIENDKVDILIGGSTTPTTMAAIPLAEAAGMPFISLAGAVVIIEPVKKWVFKTPHTDRMAAEKIFTDMKKKGISKFAMVSENVGFGKSGHDETIKIMGNYGMTLVADETYAPKDPDVTAQLTKIKNTPGVQAVINWGFGQSPAVVTKNYKQLGISAPLYQSHGVASKDYIKLAGDAAEGVRLPAAGLVVANQLPDSDMQKAVVVKFQKEYQADFKAEASTFAGHAFDGLQMALAAMQRAGGTDKAKVRDEIEKTSGYIGTGGTVHMSATDHMGLNLSAFHMVEIKKGDFALSN